MDVSTYIASRVSLVVAAKGRSEGDNKKRFGKHGASSNSKPRVPRAIDPSLSQGNIWPGLFSRAKSAWAKLGPCEAFLWAATLQPPDTASTSASRVARLNSPYQSSICTSKPRFKCQVLALQNCSSEMSPSSPEYIYLVGGVLVPYAMLFANSLLKLGG